MMSKQICKLLVLFLLLVLPVSVFAIVEQSSIRVFAVTTEGQGMAAKLTLKIEPGNGTVWSAVKPLVGTSTQNTERLAVKIARNYFKDVDKLDYKFIIESDASLVDGPSAGAAMTLLTISALQDKKVFEHVTITGTITEDGDVGPVGGTFDKAIAASKSGIKLMMIPKGEATQTVKLESGIQSINLVSYGPKELKMKIVEVANIDEVLQYAFLDPEEIDINVTEQGTPEFVPEPIAYAKSLGPMQGLTKKHIDETKVLLDSARSSLEASLLQSPNLFNSLLFALSDAQKNLRKAELLYDQNYLYSSANFAFLARVNAWLVKDIVESPQMVSANSTAFELKVSALKNEILDLKSDLREFVPYDKLEWHISAKQRLTYAEQNVDSLLNAQTVIVDAGGIVGDDLKISIEEIQKYETARGWLVVAKDLYAISSQSEQKIKPIKLFEEEAERLLVEAEKGLSNLPRDDAEDISRRFNAAKKELRDGWDEAALFDAATAVALVNANLATKDKDFETLSNLLTTKIETVENNIYTSKHTYIWPELYLAHAKYFLREAQFYLKLDQRAKATQSLKGGIGLIFLAEAMLIASNDVLNSYEKAEKIEASQTPEKVGGVQTDDIIRKITYTEVLVILVPIILLLVLLIFLVGKMLLQMKRKGGEENLPEEIKNVKKLVRKLDEALAEGKISEEKHKELSERYKKELDELLKIKESETSHILELDKLKSELSAFEHRMRDLKKHYKEGYISTEEYVLLSEQYRNKIEGFRQSMKSEVTEIEKQQDKVREVKDTYKPKPKREERKPAEKEALKEEKEKPKEEKEKPKKAEKGKK